MICRKCDASGTILIRKEYWYCNTCFITNTNHKFRACLGKSKILSANEKVLICLSGGASSIVLLDLIHSGASLEGTKRLRIIPHFLHLIENTIEDCWSKAHLLIEQCKKYNFNLYVVNINEYYSTKEILLEPNIVVQTNSEIQRQMKLNIPTTIYQDVIIKIKRHLFLRIANKLGCKSVFTAETTTKLAKRLLTNLSIGRGSQVENDIGFSDQRDEAIKIIRPMKDITNEEIDYFIKAKHLNPVYDNSNRELGLQLVVDRFVSHLQENFPSTISTVCKTADKLGSMENNKNDRHCALCQSNIAMNGAKLTAVEATIFSHQMCFKKTGGNDNVEDLQSIRNDESPMFPGLHETLCYGCSRNFSDLDNCILNPTI